jgi:hypothetical protein
MINLAVMSVGCSQFHSPAQRLARWLKAHWHRTGIESFPFSNDFLPLQVVVDATLVKERLMDLQQQGIVKLGPNRVVITNQNGQERETCRWYTLAKAQWKSTLAS